MQDGKPLGYYTRKLNKSQRNYTVGERELLSVFVTTTRVITVYQVIRSQLECITIEMYRKRDPTS